MPPRSDKGEASAKRHAIGPASEFYRLRVTTVDATGAPRFEWRDDILYRSPNHDVPDDRVEWTVEAVRTDGDEGARPIRRFESYDAARAFFEEAEEALREMTKSQFEQDHLGDV
ncbi:MAG TPA: hypothetical protein VFH17_02845 [Coriobacteriia bacterium]|nr:hypothetical protein [Coriobacteriia bacterium]